MHIGDEVTPIFESSWYYGFIGIVHQTNKYGAFVLFPDRMVKNIITFFPYSELETTTRKG